MSNICHICGRDVVSPVDPVCQCADEIERLEARVAELEHDNNNLRQVIQSRAEIKALKP